MLSAYDIKKEKTPFFSVFPLILVGAVRLELMTSCMSNITLLQYIVYVGNKKYNILSR